MNSKEIQTNVEQILEDFKTKSTICYFNRYFLVRPYGEMTKKDTLFAKPKRTRKKKK